jgi:hypothetical protein
MNFDFVAIGAGIFLALFFAAHALKSGIRISIPFFYKPKYNQTVYFLQSKGYPDLIKIGYTRRRTHLRRKELEAQLGGELTILFTVSMPFGYQVEQATHHMLRAKGWQLCRSKGLGSEWYVTSDFDTVRACILEAARLVERRARCRWSWPKTRYIRVFQAGKPVKILKSILSFTV